MSNFSLSSLGLIHRYFCEMPRMMEIHATQNLHGPVPHILITILLNLRLQFHLRPFSRYRFYLYPIPSLFCLLFFCLPLLFAIRGYPLSVLLSLSLALCSSLTGLSLSLHHLFCHHPTLVTGFTVLTIPLRLIIYLSTSHCAHHLRIFAQPFS